MLDHRPDSCLLFYHIKNHLNPTPKYKKISTSCYSKYSHYKGKYEVSMTFLLWKQCYFYRSFFFFFFHQRFILKSESRAAKIPRLSPRFSRPLSVFCLGLRTNKSRHILFSILSFPLCVRRFRRVFFREPRCCWRWGGSLTYLSKEKFKTRNCMHAVKTYDNTVQ